MQGGGPAPSDAEAWAILRSLWAVEGPIGHHLERCYLETAERIAARMAQVLRDEEGASHHHGEWTVDVGNGAVSFRPDRIVEQPWGAVRVQALGLGRVRHGRCEGDPRPHAGRRPGALPRPSDPRRDPRPGGRGGQRARHTDSDDALEPYRAAIAGIERGDFGARPNVRRCHTCPFYFVCGA